MPETDPEQLAAQDRCYVVAPAGCGKTELIVRAVALNSGRRELVLTHTNAGVAALRRRFERLGVPRDRYKVETITGFALRYASSYPNTSGLSVSRPRGGDWGSVMAGAMKVLKSRVAARVLPNSFGGLYVDEYQDCTTEHHEMVLRLAEFLPTRIVGDPLQAIFDFKGQTIIDWATIDAEFRRLPDLTTPWRWVDGNRALGEWLLSVRADLERGLVPNFAGGPAGVGSNAPASQTLTCARLRDEASVVAIRQWPKDAHAAARRLGGLFTSMDEVEGKDLHDLAVALDKSTGCDRALNTLAAAAYCVTGVGKHLDPAIKRLEAGEVPTSRTGAANAEAVDRIGEVATADDRRLVANALQAIANIPGVVVFRRELFEDLCRIAALGDRSPSESLSDVAWRVRDATRRSGRKVDARVVSRTLLVKGLEFDHAIILDTSDWVPFRRQSDARNLYVAMTRGKHSLTVLTA